MKQKKGGIITGVVVVGVIVSLLFALVSESTSVDTTNISTETVTIVEFKELDVEIDPATVVDTNVVFTESDDNAYVVFVDENPDLPLPFGSEKATFETNTVLFDSDQIQFPNSTFFTIPLKEQSLTDQDGNLLDLGSMQTSFFLKLTNGGTNVNAEGTVSFFLDDDLIDNKVRGIWASDQSGSTNIELSVCDDCDKISERKKAFTFTISDVGKDWIDGSDHYYRVIINEITVQTENEEFSFTGEFLAYELKVQVEGSKKVVLDDENNAINIFKTDSTLQLCGQIRPDNSHLPFGNRRQESVPRPVTILDSERNVIPLNRVTGTAFSLGSGGIDRGDTWQFFFTTDTKLSSFSSNIYGTNLSCGDKFTGIPRGSDLIFLVDGIDYPVTTPLSQKNYIEIAYLTGSNMGVWSGKGVATNFGYDP